MGYKRPIEILMVDDDPGDVELTREMFEEQKIAVNLQTARDGVEALAYLRREGEYGRAVRPDVILLDLNMPRMDGREVLSELKHDADLKAIPVVVLTTSEAEEDVLGAYHLGANCYISKPVGLEQMAKIVTSIEDFWFTVVKLPPRRER